jgi:hypothetical protein
LPVSGEPGTGAERGHRGWELNGAGRALSRVLLGAPRGSSSLALAVRLMVVVGEMDDSWSVSRYGGAAGFQAERGWRRQGVG